VPPPVFVIVIVWAAGSGAIREPAEQHAVRGVPKIGFGVTGHRARRCDGARGDMDRGRPSATPTTAPVALTLIAGSVELHVTASKCEAAAGGVDADLQ